jgi:hypothetical protein
MVELYEIEINELIKKLSFYLSKSPEAITNFSRLCYLVGSLQGEIEAMELKSAINNQKETKSLPRDFDNLPCSDDLSPSEKEFNLSSHIDTISKNNIPTEQVKEAIRLLKEKVSQTNSCCDCSGRLNPYIYHDELFLIINKIFGDKLK